MDLLVTSWSDDHIGLQRVQKQGGGGPGTPMAEGMLAEGRGWIP